MEHPCHKCGAPVEQGAPFCKQCRAPQIRVLGFEPEPPPARSGESSIDVLPQPALPTLPLPFLRAQNGAVQWSRALPGAALGGVFSLIAILFSHSTMIPDLVFGLASLAGGVLAVMLYLRNSAGIAPAPGIGARIGIASGGFGFLYFAVLKVAQVVYHPVEVRDAMFSLASQLATQGYPHEKVAQVQQMADSAEGKVAFLAAVLLMALLIMVIGSSIGGAFYAAWSKRRSQP